MLKKITLVFLLIQSLVWGQNFSANWRGYFSYNSIVATTNSESNIYIAANNSIFKHSIASRTNTEFTSINGVSSEDIKILHFSAEFNSLIIGFANGLIQIIDETTGQITTLNDITEVQRFPPSNVVINSLFEDNGILYIATGFGIVEYDLSKKAFADTYLISDSLSIISNITAVGVIGDLIIASIEGRGLFRGNKRNQNLLLANQWQRIDANGNTTFTDFRLFSGQLIARNNTINTIYAFSGGVFNSVYTDPSNITNLSINDDILAISHTDKHVQLNRNFTTSQSINYSAELNKKVNHTIFIDNKIYFSVIDEGYFITENNFVSQTRINPIGPLRNDAYDIDYKNGDLWMCYGKINNFYGFIDDDSQNGLSRLREGNWMNIPYEDFNIDDIVSIKIDPRNTERVIFGSYSGGVADYNSGNFRLFTNTNSNIERVFNRDVVFGTEFDQNGNLWYINSFNTKFLKRFSLAGTTNDEPDLGIFIPPPENPDNKIFLLNAQELVFNNSGNIFIGSFSNGLFAYNPRTKKVAFTEEGYPNRNITTRAVAIDNDGTLWIGTDRGLRILENPDQLFNESNTTLTTERIVFSDNGLNQELLAGQTISDIKVDPENNKWICTIGGGVFQVSPDGQETIRHFTVQNSPLPSNNVTRVAINTDTNSIFFATEKGLVEFSIDNITAKESLSELKIFPNPVRPEYNNPTVRVEGLTAEANVKITDIEGNLVFETTNTPSNGGGSGVIEWDTRSFSGNLVASGVYLFLITSEDQQQTKVGKLLIVR